MRTFPYRSGLFAVALALDVVLCAAPAPAAIDMAIGDQRVVTTQPISDCTTRAENALRTLLQAPSTGGGGTEFMALAPVQAPATPPRAASIHCFPLDKGYLVTFECAVEIPPNPTPASDLCTKLVAAFDASQSADTGSNAAEVSR
ncbi:MAG: hypothetical protein JO092_05710 [Candidatus Eremiobacteraeota bacterium]|nr:hypothetical protein [Candidatus Eremiobacteraeota bacterium]MBV8374775.1 hypothetical protein [Candidatus Eremiobacteraeota bacterium]